MEDLLISTLELLGYPVRLQGSLLPKEVYPPHFFTYWNDSTEGDDFFNNKEGAMIWNYSVNFYSVDPELVNKMFKTLENEENAKSLLIKAGFVVLGSGYSVASDEPTHTGRGVSLIFKQKQ